MGRCHFISRWNLYTATALLALLGSSGIASAQEHRLFIGGAFSQFPVDTHDVSNRSPSTSYDNASADSTARGITGEAGWVLKDSVAVGVEVTAPLRRNDLTSVRRAYTGGPASIASRYRETAIFAVLRVPLMRSGRVRPALLGGGGVVLGSSLERYASVLNRGGSIQFGPYGDETAVSGRMFGATGGADVTIQVSRHVSVVPQVRLTRIARGAIGNSRFGHFGLPKLPYRIGLGIRVTL